MSDDIITLCGEEYIRGTAKKFKFNGVAQKNEDGKTWRIHVAADHWVSSDVASTYHPVLELARLYNWWYGDMEHYGQT